MKKKEKEKEKTLNQKKINATAVGFSPTTT